MSNDSIRPYVREIVSRNSHSIMFDAGLTIGAVLFALLSWNLGIIIGAAVGLALYWLFNLIYLTRQVNRLIKQSANTASPEQH